MKYKAINSNGRIAKAMYADDVIWKGKYPGMPPELENALKYSVIIVNNKVYYDGPLTFKEYASYKLKAETISGSSYVYTTFHTSDDRVISDYGSIREKGSCTVTIYLKMKVPNMDYEINEARKVFEVTVM